jgi:Protein of unknown function (DUF3551)
MRQNIRYVTLAALAVVSGAAATIAGASPAAAFDYPYCLQGKQTGIPGDCNYASYAQCMASASGRDAYCAINPRVAYDRPMPRRRGQRAYPDYYND